MTRFSLGTKQVHRSILVCVSSLSRVSRRRWRNFFEFVNKTYKIVCHLFPVHVINWTVSPLTLHRFLFVFLSNACTAHAYRRTQSHSHLTCAHSCTPTKSRQLYILAKQQHQNALSLFQQTVFFLYLNFDRAWDVCSNLIKNFVGDKTFACNKNVMFAFFSAVFAYISTL